jgi:translation initiation factor 2B subunit (eIF-2B alpha/beta/delta family)
VRSHRIDRKLKAIYRDKKSGASVLTTKLFSVLIDAIEEVDGVEDFNSLLISIGVELRKHHPLLFQLRNLIDIVQGFSKEVRDKEEILSEILSLRERFENSASMVAEGFRQFLSERGKVSIATLSHSGTVFNSLVKARDFINEVYIFRSCPKCEGEKMGDLLFKSGFNVFVVNDFGLSYVVRKVDLVVSGCDAVFEDGSILNKAGTLPLFVLAKNFGKVSVVLADFLKFVNERVNFDEIFKDAVELKSKGKVKELNLLFEIVDGAFITHYVTNKS